MRLIKKARRLDRNAAIELVMKEDGVSRSVAELYTDQELRDVIKRASWPSIPLKADF